ncbi:MAG: hypothetical protein CFE26_08660 [Verrucomicrobiales bacterium VVV1]|nr:MAG: hypothetical protein CFE26_08660 [Verrucomicrobiales bacterium VVV1]
MLNQTSFPQSRHAVRKERQQQPNTETMIRNYSKTIGALAAASALVAGSASAEIEGQLQLGYNTDYIFRGFSRGQDMVEAGSDIATQWNGIDLSAGLWYASVQDGHVGNVGPVQLPDGYDELDIYAEASKDFGFATAYVGYIRYQFLGTDVQILGNNVRLIDDFAEVYFGLSRELFWGINGAVTYYWDIEGDNGGYSELRLDKTFKLHECVDLVAGARAGYSFEEGQHQHTTLSLTFNVKASDSVTISPYVAYSFQGSALENVDSNPLINKFGLPAQLSPQRDQFFGGVKVAVSF